MNNISHCKSNEVYVLYKIFKIESYSLKNFFLRTNHEPLTFYGGRYVIEMEKMMSKQYNIQGGIYYGKKSDYLLLTQG